MRELIERLITSRFKSATFGPNFVVLFLFLRDNWVFMVFNKLKNFYVNNIWPSVRPSVEDAGGVDDRPSVQPSPATGAVLTHSVSISKHQLLRHKRRASGRLPEPQFGGQKFSAGLAVEPALSPWLVSSAAFWLEFFPLWAGNIFLWPGNSFFQT